MCKEPEQRIGIKLKAEIKNHPFFFGVDWQKVYNKDYAAPQISELEEENFNADKGVVKNLKFFNIYITN